MIKKTVYVADDGKEFATKKECEEYERSMSYKFVMCDDDLKPVSDFADASFVSIRDDAELKVLQSHCEYYGYSIDGIDNPGIYWWDSENYRHTHIENVIAYFQDALNVMKKMGEKDESI